MKYLVHLSRLFVGGLFIFSGLIKLNDPVGFAFKLEEYFGPTVFDMSFLEPLALPIAIFVVIFEVFLGVLLLLGYKPKFTVYSLLAMIIFFTFLTWYSAYYNKVTDCGCFGDAIKLTPWESFTKDVILLVFILILYLGIKHIKPLFNKGVLNVISGIALLLCVLFAYHVLNHLPVKDFRPYKIGDNIQENMIIPDDAPKPVIDYHWTFLVDGNETVITTNGSYPEVDGEYVSVTTETVVEGYEPPIHDFSMEKDGEDYTEDLLNKEKLFVVIAYNLAKSNEKGLKALKELSEKAIQSGYEFIGLTASGPEEQEAVSKTFGLNFDFYFCDETALKTIVRSNPGILKLKRGTILEKVHFNDLEDLTFD
ncbi:MAG: DoxX family membrane protein [Flavobacteriaceae bacterium]|nr:DoxX family membrane protein [Bacteroidia bacterium]MBT8286520.1 DoxX family membrane protein [Bacteroidia bacterium]NNF73554.1 DoxX family membrane protein [Flavobacteriaceae bacterium]NNK73713.1 DoxX family membrane protein [Flavobacteriaceae bacterium]